MKAISRLVTLLFFIALLLSSVQPCGPGYITPLFDTSAAPEAPYTDYAAGRLGIVKPEFRRSVLLAAYRYIAGSGLNAPEQQAMIEVWKAEFDYKDFRDDSVDAAVKAWIEKRKDVVGKEEKVPDIYAEHTDGDYQFFPNCTKNAFETASETLADRVSNHGPSDPNVGNWVKAQDQVFGNCASGKQTPDAAPAGAPDWLQKDRAYQIAAASFYSLDYNDAKRRFAEIAQDSDSPWRETADYLVARTLIRQASLTKSVDKAGPLYDEAETHLQKFISGTGKFSSSADRLLGLIKFRRHPKERVSELAKTLSFNGGNENFRQDVIDYNWLLDKFETDVLNAEEKRKQEEELKKHPETNANTAPVVDNTQQANKKKNDSDLEISIYSADGAKSWTIYVKADATDDDAIAEAERVVGAPLTDALKTQVRQLRQTAYASRFKENQSTGVEGRYYGEEKLTRALTPDFLRQDDLTDWLFTFQTAGVDAYMYSLKRFKETGSELWLMTALSKADKNSTGLPRLLEAANNASRTSPAYPTIAYHLVRVMLAQGKTDEARKLLDDIINTGDTLPVSTRNSFVGLRLTLAQTLDDFLRDSLRTPYGFDFDGEAGSIDAIIAEQKAQFNPEYNTDGREAYEREIDENYKIEKVWQERTMFDADTIEVLNQHFSTAGLQDVLKSPALPEYLHDRFLLAIWTRAYLLDDMATVLKITPELAKYHPDFAPELEKVTAAKTQAALDHAVLFFVLKNPLLSPYIEDGMGKTDNEQGDFDANDWWCAPYDTEHSDTAQAEVPKVLPRRPAFLTAAQSQAAQAERAKLKAIGDAPKFLAGKVMAWAKANPTDKRIPEALYIVIQANGWTKYGCGNDSEGHDAMADYLKKHYSGNEWTAKLIADETEK